MEAQGNPVRVHTLVRGTGGYVAGDWEKKRLDLHSSRKRFRSRLAQEQSMRHGLHSVLQQSRTSWVNVMMLIVVTNPSRTSSQRHV